MFTVLCYLTLMPYSSFQLSELVKRFDLLVSNEQWLFNPPQLAPSLLLQTWLAQNASFAIAQSTEKARSEFMIAPILAEIRQHLSGQVALFSGVEFVVDEANGLSGVCDFLFSRSKQNLYIEAPVLSVVEAKNESFKQGIAQVGAEMVAAQRFNQREGLILPVIFGAVTIGNEWQFLKLEGQQLSIDNKQYDLEELPEILGILAWMLSNNHTNLVP
jgi:hypothetical protein